MQNLIRTSTSKIHQQPSVSPFDSDDGTVITKSKPKKTLKKSSGDNNIKKRKVVLDSASESEAEAEPIKKKRVKKSSFAFDLEGDNELQEPIRAAALRSFLSRRAGSGYTLQRADPAKTGDYYVELRVYNTKEAEKLGSDRWKRSLVTLKSAVEDNSPTWKAITKSSILLLVAVAATCAAPPSSASVNNLTEDSKEPSTHEILSSLGLKKLRIPAAHHRKRLAEQGRRHATGDSRMYVIKLPPNTSYYTHSDPAPAAARTLPLQMTSNGKPARVYHWNLPVLTKLAKNRPQARFDDDVVDVESTPTWPKGANNHPNSLDSLAYYVPAKKTSFRKYFSGNGKPKSFYVIEKNKHMAPQYHRLLP